MRVVFNFFKKIPIKTAVLECVFNKVEGLMHTPLLKRDSITGVFSVNFARIFRTHILYNM